ncbi:hypothetical protein K502DRAFT_323448 [Neoconidiobolus thromboides FSU 785]|nr:hypothetical protein K502DRAFT_323448 [Neoconidiobolus thromboides FSU 785]
MCSISSQKIADAMGATDSDLGYAITIDKSMELNSETSLKLSLSGKDKYKGILMYVTDGGEEERYGKFNTPSGFKECSSNCKGKASEGSMLTHNSKDYKDPNITFEWTAPKLSECKKLKLRVAIVKEMESFQVLKDIDIPCSTAKPPTSATSTQSESLSTPVNTTTPTEQPQSSVSSSATIITDPSTTFSSVESTATSPATTSTKPKCKKRY